jgi:hypothetical protein
MLKTNSKRYRVVCHEFKGQHTKFKQSPLKCCIKDGSLITVATERIVAEVERTDRPGYPTAK